MFDDINQFTTRGMRYEIERLDTSWRIMDMETGERVYFAPYYEEWQRSAEQLLAILVVLNRRLENVESGLRRLERLITD